MRFLPLFLLLLLSVRVHSQIKDQDLESVTVKSKKLSVRDILDSVVKNAPRNYAEPTEFAGTYTASYVRGTDTVFYLQQPVYLKKREDFIYGFPQIDSTEANVLKDSIQSEAQHGHIALIEHLHFPAFSNIMAFMNNLDDIASTKHILYASDGNEADPHFYLLICPEGKMKISPLARPFMSSLNRDSLFHYALLKIRRRGWVLTNYERTTLLNDPAKLEALIHTSSYIRAKELIDSAKAQPIPRRDLLEREWRAGGDGRYRIYRNYKSDNLFNFRFVFRKRFPDLEGFIGTSEIVYDYEKEVPEKRKPFTLDALLKDRKKY